MPKPSVQNDLREETEKWREKLAERLKEVSSADADGEDIVANSRAYLEDSQHFEAEEDLIRAFEAVIWGWAWLEIGEELGVIED